MRCEHVLTRLSAYMDGELEAALYRQVAEHLTGCPECRGALEDLRGVDTLIGGLPRLNLPPDFAGVVMSKVRDTAPVEPRQSLLSRRWKRLLDHCEKFFDLLEPEARVGTRSLDELDDIPACFIGHAYFRVLGLQG